MRFAVKFFLSHELLNSRKRRTFYAMSYLQGPWKYGKVKEAVESAKAGLTLLRRAWESWEENRKRPRKEEGGSSEGNVPCVPNQEFIFFGSRGLGRDPSQLKYRLLRYFFSREPCAKEVPETDYLTQQK
jgi:hypothetical protein